MACVVSGNQPANTLRDNLLEHSLPHVHGMRYHLSSSTMAEVNFDLRHRPRHTVVVTNAIEAEHTETNTTILTQSPVEDLEEHDRDTPPWRSPRLSDVDTMTDSCISVPPSPPLPTSVHCQDASGDVSDGIALSSFQPVRSPDLTTVTMETTAKSTLSTAPTESKEVEVLPSISPNRTSAALHSSGPSRHGVDSTRQITRPIPYGRAATYPPKPLLSDDTDAVVVVAAECDSPMAECLARMGRALRQKRHTLSHVDAPAPFAACTRPNEMSRRMHLSPEAQARIALFQRMFEGPA